jgi:hypothetical protein
MKRFPIGLCVKMSPMEAVVKGVSKNLQNIRSPAETYSEERRARLSLDLETPPPNDSVRVGTKLRNTEPSHFDQTAPFRSSCRHELDAPSPDAYRRQARRHFDAALRTVGRVAKISETESVNQARGTNVACARTRQNPPSASVATDY